MIGYPLDIVAGRPWVKTLSTSIIIEIRNPQRSHTECPPGAREWPAVARRGVELTKVSPEVLKAFGTAMKRARALRGWAPAPSAASSRRWLGLDDGLIAPFLDTDTTDERGETKAERDADRILDRLTRDKATRRASEDLLILLANRYAAGTHRELETAYIGVRAALEEFVKMKARSDAPDNADGQFQAVMAGVTRLNEAGDADAAGDALDEAMARIGQARDTIYQQQPAQDRIRNCPNLTAKTADQSPAPPGPAGRGGLGDKSAVRRVAGSRRRDRRHVHVTRRAGIGQVQP